MDSEYVESPTSQSRQQQNPSATSVTNSDEAFEFAADNQSLMMQ